MIKRIFSVAALSLMLTACGGDDAAEGDGATVDSTAVTTMPGTDTVSQPTVVPTTDSVVTTTTTETDTVQGQATTASDTPVVAHP
jgi:hypothetical protein